MGSWGARMLRRARTETLASYNRRLHLQRVPIPDKDIPNFVVRTGSNAKGESFHTPLPLSQAKALAHISVGSMDYETSELGLVEANRRYACGRLGDPYYARMPDQGE